MERIIQMEQLVERLQGAQLRQDGSSNAMHVRRVRTIAMDAVRYSGEAASLPDVVAFECAALGHDLLEDTPLTDAQIVPIAGEQGLTWIRELTNTWGDAHTGPYVAQVTGASEEARLIKYADLCDNTWQASYNIRVLGVPWMRDFFLPIIDPMSAALLVTSFERYPQSAGSLRMMHHVARAHLAESISMMERESAL